MGRSFYYRWDHPHIHGEHSYRRLSSWINSRITPIYMGSTNVLTLIRWPTRDHPHIHGEHSPPKSGSCALTGSPPYTWGAHSSDFDDFADDRITPIYMGSTHARFHWFITGQDHPHIHGEHTQKAIDEVRATGSPPYTWGARLLQRPIGLADGITPIYMGSTTR